MTAKRISNTRDEVDVPLPEAGVDVAQPVPLLGQGAQRLGEEGESINPYRELALPRLHDGSCGPDPVTPVEVVEGGMRVLTDGVARNEQLDVAAPVTKGRERELSLTSEQQKTTGDSHLVRGLRAGLDAPPALVCFGGRVRPVEPHRVRIRPTGAQRVDLRDPPRPFVLRLLAHWLRSKMIRRPWSVSQGS